MTEQEARAIYHQGEEAVVAKLLEYDARLTRLEEMLGLNSKNSSKPIVHLKMKRVKKRT